MKANMYVKFLIKLEHFVEVRMFPACDAVFVLCLIGIFMLRIKHLVVDGLVNGDDAEKDAYPWHVVIYETNGQTRKCGGALISNKWVITTAICVMHPCLFGVGDHSAQNTEKNTLLRSSKTINHPDFDGVEPNVALAELMFRINFESNVKPIRLPPYRDIPLNFDGEKALFSGHGLMEYQGNWSSTLQGAKMRILSNTRCEEYFPHLRTSQVCANGWNTITAACNADEGSPLVRNEKDKEWSLVGLVDVLAHQCSALVPIIFIRVEPYLEWIHEITGISYWAVDPFE